MAWAYPPNGGAYAGDIFFNRQYGWTFSRAFSYDRYLYRVAAHEIGHSIGLPHSSEKTSLMYSYYDHKPVPILSDSDIANIQSLYGM